MLPEKFSIGPRLLTVVGVAVLVMSKIAAGDIAIPDFVPPTLAHNIVELNEFCVGVYKVAEPYLLVILGLATSPQAGLLVSPKPPQ